jgi:hypothetical protein
VRLLSPSCDAALPSPRRADNAPPKWAFNNISAIRENTDRILELLEREHKADTGGAAMPLHDTDET